MRLENLTVDCDNSPFLDFRRGGAVSLKNCSIGNYNSGAGGSNAVFAVETTLLVDGCTFDGSKGRYGSAPGSRGGNAFDLRGNNRAYVRDTEFVDNSEIGRSYDVTFDGCTARYSAGGGPGPWGWGASARFARGSPIFGPVGRAPVTFEVALDEAVVVDALAAGRRVPDAFCEKGVEALGCVDDPVYWLGLVRDGRPGVRATALTRLGSMGVAPRPLPTVEPDGIPVLLRELGSDKEEVVRKARLVLCCADAKAVEAAVRGSGELAPLVHVRLDEIRRLRGLAVPIGVEVEYSRLVNERIP